MNALRGSRVRAKWLQNGVWKKNSRGVSETKWKNNNRRYSEQKKLKRIEKKQQSIETNQNEREKLNGIECNIM